MKKVIILFCLMFFSLKAYPFWIWSPKTQKWKNPKYSALATPYLQYKEAIKLFEEGKYKEAHREFKKVLMHYPDAKEAAEAQYYLASCLEKMDKPYEAFLEYQKLIDSYPNSKRINEVVEREYNIGELFLNREHKKWLGMSLYDFIDHPSVEIFTKIVAKVPYSEYAPRAQYKLGIILMKLARYDEARSAFQKVIDDYSDSEWSAPAKYQLAIATAKSFPGADYDSSYLKEATDRLDEFIKDHPEAKISSEAEEQLEELKNREAKKQFDIASFYEKQGYYDSASIYYKKVVDIYPDSNHYSASLSKIDEMDALIRGNMTKQELTAERKQQEAQRLRDEKIRLKEQKILEKQIRIRKEKELKEKKIKEKREKAKRKKEAARLYKDALSLYIEKKYKDAYDKFLEVKELVTPYKNTDYYLEIISQTINIDVKEDIGGSK